MIEVSSLSYHTGKFSLRDISFRVENGETMVVLGPTGAGKTVLLELIAGFRKPDAGEIHVGEKSVTYMPPERRKIGIVYQDYMLFPHLSVRDNIAYGLRRSQHISSNWVASRVEDIARQLVIDHLLDRRTRRLSGGEQQRVALARTLIVEPEILLLDEPFSAVDPSTKEMLMRELGMILESRRIPVIYVTHDQIEASEMADRIAIMNEGKIVQLDLPEDVLRAPKSEFVAGFMGTRNILRGRASRSDGMTAVEIGNVILYSSIELEGDAHVTIRPEDIIVSKERLESSARNSLKCRVMEISEKGGIVHVKGDCGIELTASITRESFKDLRITLEDEIFMTFKASNVNLF